MKTVTLSKMFAALGAVALWTFMSPASALIVLDFTEIPDEGGIVATETGGPGGAGSLTVPGESIALLDRNQPGALGNFSGLGNPTKHIYNMLEEWSSFVISDQVIVFAACPGALVPPCDVVIGFGGTRVLFQSDPALFDMGPAENTITEDGTRQFLGSYINNAGDTVQIFATSDIPEPASLALLGLGLLGLGFARRKVKK